MHQSEVDVYLEYTPNPNTLKYTVNRTLIERGAVNILRPQDAPARSPLAAQLFLVPGIAAVMIGRDFVTITKSEEGDWEAVHKGASVTIRDHLSAGLPVVLVEADGGASSAASEMDRQILRILDEEIRPAVAQDGGDVIFDRFEDGVVYLSLQGACAGCPSSTMTLKMGIERRLQTLLPQVREVVSV